MTTKREIAVALVSLLLGGTATYGAARDTPLEKLEDAQTAYHTQHGKYFQVIEYQAPNGTGWQVIYRDEAGIHSKGYGVEADQRTYHLPPSVASSTR